MSGVDARVDDEGAIRRLIENRAIWRDVGDWDRLATAWTPGGRMLAVWSTVRGDLPGYDPASPAAVKGWKTDWLGREPRMESTT